MTSDTIRSYFQTNLFTNNKLQLDEAYYYNTIALSHLAVRMCLIHRASGICIPQWLYLGIGSGPSFIITTFDFQFRCMKCSLSLPDFFLLLGIHLPVTPPTSVHTEKTPHMSPDPLCRCLPPGYVAGIYRAFSTYGGVVTTPPSPPPHSFQIALVFFRSQNVAPSPFSLLLGAAFPCCPQKKPGLHTIALSLSIFFRSLTLLNILTTATRVVWTHMRLFPTMRQPS